MITTFADTFDTLLNLQRALQARAAAAGCRIKQQARVPSRPSTSFSKAMRSSLSLSCQASIRSGVSVQLDADGIKAEYRDGILALFLPRSERDKPRAVKIS